MTGRVAPFAADWNALAATIAATGTVRFAPALHALLAQATGADLSSVFRRERIGAPAKVRVTLLHAGGEHPAEPDFARRASLAYVREHWRADRDVNRAVGAAAPSVHIVRQRADDLPTGSWRRELYLAAGVAERLTAIEHGDAATVVNVYALHGRTGFGAAATEALAALAPVVVALADQHRATRQPAGPADAAGLATLLAQRDLGLSRREAQVVSAMMLGETQDEIARRQSIARDTVVTYRRRAYGKLGIGNARDLRALHGRLLREQAAPFC